MHQIIKILTGEFAGKEADLKTWEFSSSEGERFSILSREGESAGDDFEMELILDGYTEFIEKKGRKIMEAWGVNGNDERVSLEYKVICEVD